jgi:hypothetical protein
MTFRKALAEAADRGFSEGVISPQDYTQVSALVNSTSLNRVAALEASSRHLLSLGNGSIDWSSIVATLQALLPIIIQILQLLQKKV